MTYFENDVDQGRLHVKAFADLFQKDYDLLVEGYKQAGYEDGIPTIDEYNQYLLHQGQFDPKITDKGWKAIRRAILDATILVPIYEVISGKQVITRYELTSGERLGQGITAAVGLFSMGLGIYGLISKAGLGVLSAKEIVLYAAGHYLMDIGVAGFTSVTGQLLEEILPPEVARLIAAGVGFALAWKLNKWYDGKWDQYISYLHKQSILQSPYSDLWGTLEDRTNQGVKHFADYWDKYPERIPSLAERLGVDVSDFSNDVKGFENFTEQALRVKDQGILREVNGKQIYFIEGAAKAKKGVVVIFKDGKIQSMMPSDLKSFNKLN